MCHNFYRDACSSVYLKNFHQFFTLLKSIWNYISFLSLLEEDLVMKSDIVSIFPKVMKDIVRTLTSKKKLFTSYNTISHELSIKRQLFPSLWSVFEGHSLHTEENPPHRLQYRSEDHFTGILPERTTHCGPPIDHFRLNNAIAADKIVLWRSFRQHILNFHRRSLFLSPLF
jgi:hypothetical protein